MEQGLEICSVGLAGDCYFHNNYFEKNPSESFKVLKSGSPPRCKVFDAHLLMENKIHTTKTKEIMSKVLSEEESDNCPFIIAEVKQYQLV